MTTITADFSGHTYSAPKFRQASAQARRFFQARASLPDMPGDTPRLDAVAGVAARFSLALIPFGALGWLFFAV